MAESTEPRRRPAHDLADDSGAMDIYALETLVEDMRNQPLWRSRANDCADFYDGWQLTATRQAELEDAGMPISVTNLIGRTVNGALGMEAKTRLNAVLTSDDDEWEEVAAAVQSKLFELQREAYADMAISDAYKDQMMAVGWVEVSRQPDPMLYPYRVDHVHRNEIWWDWRARRKDLRDARWLVRQRLADLDEVETAMPQHRQLLRMLVGRGGGVINDAIEQANALRISSQIERVQSTTRLSDEEWMDTARARVRIYEVWYRVPCRVIVMVDKNGLRRKFDPKNPVHDVAARRGLVELIEGPSTMLRQALYVGPYRLRDVAKPNQKNFPYIPFWCYRRDKDRAPYGIVDGMISPQEEYNERRSKLLWLLRAGQVFVDNDALDTKYNNYLDLAREILRPDSTIVLNAARKREMGVRVEHNLNLASEQVTVMQDAKQLVQEVPGIYSTMLGDAPTGVTSGLAINSLVEQSLVALGEANDNYRAGRRWVFEACVDLLVEDMKKPNMEVGTGKGKTRRVIVLNTIDPKTNAPMNMVAAASLKCGLEEMPTTPAARMQQQQELGKTLQSVGNDPHAAAVLVPALIRASDLPGKDEMADWLCRQKGVPLPGEFDRQEQAGQQSGQQAQAMQMAEFQEKLAKLTADIQKVNSEVELNKAKTAQIRVETAVAAAPQPTPQPSDEERINKVLAEVE